MTDIRAALQAAGIDVDDYWSGYGKCPMGGGNPYYACIGCGLTDPEINGNILRHGKGCAEVERYIAARIRAAIGGVE